MLLKFLTKYTRRRGNWWIRACRPRALEFTGKFLWRPDLRPRLVEYVADFALAGERALADERRYRRSTRAC